MNICICFDVGYRIGVVILKKIKLSDLKKHLKTKSDKEMLSEIVELFKLSKEVQAYYGIKLDSDYEKNLLEESKDRIANHFFPSRGSVVLDYQEIKTIISDFKKVSKKPMFLAELLLCYADNGVDFTNDYGDIDQRFYNNIANAYEDALNVIVENNLENLFQGGCERIMIDAYGIGWGFSDYIGELYFNVYG